MELRQATLKDSEFAFQTKKAAFKGYVDQVWGWDENEQRQLHERRFVAQDFNVIQESGIDVGVLATVRQPDCLKVNQLYILPEHQGKGLGAECMLRIMEKADHESLPVRLQVLKVNTRAISFYQRLGFKFVGETSTHIQMEIQEQKSL
jgi:ribosomal protein S18 acetylase RimI-like enzyme